MLLNNNKLIVNMLLVIAKEAVAGETWSLLLTSTHIGRLRGCYNCIHDFCMNLFEESKAIIIFEEIILHNVKPFFTGVLYGRVQLVSAVISLLLFCQISFEVI